MTTASSTAPRWLSPGQAMRHMSVNKQTFRQVRDQLHPVVIPGMKEPRYDREVIDAFMEAHRIDLRERQDEEKVSKMLEGVVQ